MRPGRSDPRAPELLPGSRLAPLTVSELNDLADAHLREGIGPVWVSGEIVRFVRHASGHWYFSLTDGRASIACAMFRRENLRVRFDVADGLAVLALALPSVYAVQGRFQLVVQAVEPLGAGSAALAFEQLKERLAGEGLFDAARKVPLPRIARRIGIVTSPDGAALRDVLRVLARRFAGVEVLVVPTTVQGARAPEEIVEALTAADARELDVLLLVRGGGAREDLAAFDDERVVRAIASCRTPIVTGIGHEIDTTLADFAADVRAETPSAAAEVVVREREELESRLASLRTRLVLAMHRGLERRGARVAALAHARALAQVPLRLSRLAAHQADLARRLELAARSPLARRRQSLATLLGRLTPEGQRGRLVERRRRLERLVSAIRAAVAADLARSRSRAGELAGRLGALSPLGVLSRGYALVTRSGAPAAVIRDAAELVPGDGIDVRLARGSILAEVRESRPIGGRG